MAHYHRVKARLGAPVNFPPKNRLREVLAEKARNEAATKQSLLEARWRRKRAQRADRAKARFLARVDSRFTPETCMDHCPITNKVSPELREAVRIILVAHRVSWPELVSRNRRPNVLLARAAFCHLMAAIGFSNYRIAQLMGKEGQTGGASVQKLRDKFDWREIPCFSDAATCAGNMSDPHIEALGLERIDAG